MEIEDKVQPRLQNASLHEQPVPGMKELYVCDWAWTPDEISAVVTIVRLTA